MSRINDTITKTGSQPAINAPAIKRKNQDASSGKHQDINSFSLFEQAMKNAAENGQDIDELIPRPDDKNTAAQEQTGNAYLLRTLTTGPVISQEPTTQTKEKPLSFHHKPEHLLSRRAHIAKSDNVNSSITRTHDTCVSNAQSGPLPASEASFTHGNADGLKNAALAKQTVLLKQTDVARDTTDHKPENSVQGDLILRHFTHASTSPTVAQPGFATDTLNDVAKIVANRILVSVASLTDKQEVHITLKSERLADCQVKISRWQGELQIQIITPDTSKLQLMNALQTHLQKNLEERLHNETIRIQITMQEQQKEHNEGRSRQKIDLIDEIINRHNTTKT